MTVDVGAVEDFAVGAVTRIVVDRRSIGIVNAGDDFYAVLNVCPHELAPVCEGQLGGTTLPSPPGEVRFGLENRIVRCPWHGYEFDLSQGGRCVLTRFKARLRTFPVTVRDGRVLVELKRAR